ncbi:MAG: hypothetical protein SF123_19600 [Chloroflexota bacterium]|nr:hypothetical protein [Chloroflexota bacterium]
MSDTPVEQTQHEENKAWRIAQQEAGYVAVSSEVGKACASCRWFQRAGGYDGGDDCHIVSDYPLYIAPTGLCNRHETPPTPAADANAVPVYIVDAPEEEAAAALSTPAPAAKAPIIRILQPGIEAVRSVIDGLLGWSTPVPGFRALSDNRWLGIYSNDFQDREGEFFPRKAIDHFIDQVMGGVYDMPELWHFHLAGTCHGKAHFVGRDGHMVFALGTFDEAHPHLDGYREYYAQRELSTGMSHGFVYDPSMFLNRGYYLYRTFEVTTLDNEYAANAHTQFYGGSKMALNAAQIEGLRAIGYSDDEISDIQRRNGKAQANVPSGTRYAKGVAVPNGVSLAKYAPPEDEGADDDDAGDDAEQRKALDAYRAEVKAEMETLRQLMAQVQTQLKELAGTPPRRASSAPETQIQPGTPDAQVAAALNEANEAVKAGEVEGFGEALLKAMNARLKATLPTPPQS